MAQIAEEVGDEAMAALEILMIGPSMSPSARVHD